MKTSLFLILQFFLFHFSFSQNNEIWGVTEKGGVANAGTIYKTNGNGDFHTIEHSFLITIGSNPERMALTKTSSGKILWCNPEEINSF